MTSCNGALSFRPLRADDLPLLHGWLARPHVRQWWGEPSSLAELAEDFLPKTNDQSGTRGFIALRGGEPIGFIQRYVVMGSGDGWWEDETDPGARGIDQFLAHADQLGQGLGSAMVRAFVALLSRPTHRRTTSVRSAATAAPASSRWAKSPRRTDRPC
jgi:RimJ/RimL family protein N-acetyltransferase